MINTRKNIPKRAARHLLEFCGACVFGMMVFFFAVWAASCSQSKITVTDLPPGVTAAEVTNWINAVQDFDKAVSLTHIAKTAVISLNRSGAFPDGPHYFAVVRAVGLALTLEDQAGQFLKTVPNDFGRPVQQKIADFTTQILAQLGTAAAEAALGIKDSATAKVFSATLQDAVAVVNLIRGLISGFSTSEFFLRGRVFRFPPAFARG